MKPKRSSSSTPSVARSAGANRLRIIGGQWRGSKLQFPDHAAIRPTPDRVRETLFNWLQQDIIGARCLDLFAGSGALGLEALSRGADFVTFVDREPIIGRYLNDTLTRLKCTQAEVFSMDALSYLPQITQPFNGVFLDPPFSATESTDLLRQLLQQLNLAGRMTPTAWIYLECPAILGTPSSWEHWPSQWQLHRSEQAGQVGYHLARRTSASEASSS
jgi:16S rRNA (guanine966-N2)-methyltransferase